jgi:cytochrome c-type biogenesis protein CcmE
MTTPEETTPSRTAGGPRVKIFIAIGLVTLAIGYLVFSSVSTSSAYYMTITELKAAGQAVDNKKVRVAGTVVGDSIVWDARALTLSFDLSDPGGRVPVSYRGARPDMFRDGAEAVVEGRFAQQKLQANNLLLKCPSKYEAKASDGTPAAGQ